MQVLMKPINESAADFDKIYYESHTYILGKKPCGNGLEKGVFFQKEDGSVWIDLTADGLDEKIVQPKRWHCGLYNTGYRPGRK